MKSNNYKHVLAIGIDAAEPLLIRQLIDQNQLPAMKSLLERGSWMRVESPAKIGSGSVWPTFITGEDPRKHGVYGEWSWQPETMSVSHDRGRHLKPFWKALAEEGISAGVLDVPFAPLVGLREGFEISEWGAHDCLRGRMEVGPAPVTELITAQHPLSIDRLDATGADDYQNLKKLSEACYKGVELRGELARRLLKETHPRFSLIVFPEIHHAAHYLWHTVEPEHEIYDQNKLANARSFDPTLLALYREVDKQIGELVGATSDDTSIVVFSLHGMRPTHGIPDFLTRVLREKGFAQLAGWNKQSWNERARSLFGAIKRSMPQVAKTLYYKTVPHVTTQRLAQPTMLVSYDWANTRAFSLPSDQHGWIRVNLCAREAKGIVPLSDYRNLCDDVEELLRSLTTENGKPLVSEIIRLTPSVDEASASRLPDLVVHWESAAFAAPLRIKSIPAEHQPIGKKFTGQHSLEGFCILNTPTRMVTNDSLQAKDMHKLIKKMLMSG